MKMSGFGLGHLVCLLLPLHLAGCGGGGGDGDGGNTTGPPVAVATVVITSPTSAVAIGALGRVVQFVAEPRSAAGVVLTGRTVSWASSNGSVANVSPSGALTAVGVGSTQVTASAEGRTSTAVSVTVTQVTASVAVMPSSHAFSAVAQTRQFSAEARDSGSSSIAGKTFTWSTSNAAVVTVSSTGLATAAGNGSAQVRAMVDGVTGFAAVTVGSGGVPSFATEVQPIFNSSCTSCHSGVAAQAGLSLAQGEARGNLVNVPSTQVPSVMRVLPSNADNSYLVRKLEGGPGIVGDRMPQGGSLSAGAITTIRNWIAGGAPDN